VHLRFLADRCRRLLDSTSLFTLEYNTLVVMNT
jgi:hypothetical protein